MRRELLAEIRGLPRPRPARRSRKQYAQGTSTGSEAENACSNSSSDSESIDGANAETCPLREVHNGLLKVEADSCAHIPKGSCPVSALEHLKTELSSELQHAEVKSPGEQVDAQRTPSHPRTLARSSASWSSPPDGPLEPSEALSARGSGEDAWSGGRSADAYESASLEDSLGDTSCPKACALPTQWMQRS